MVPGEPEAAASAAPQIDPADRLVWEPGGAAQCDLWFPPRKIPLEDGTAKRTTTRYDRARPFDRHATYIVAAYLAGAAQ